MKEIVPEHFNSEGKVKLSILNLEMFIVLSELIIFLSADSRLKHLMQHGEWKETDK